MCYFSFCWSFFLIGDQYYRVSYPHGVDQGYPRPLSVWDGLPDTIDAAFQYSNSRTYFFSGSNYYRFNDNEFRVDDTYPRSTAVWWLGCDPVELGLAEDPSDDADHAAVVVPSLVAVIVSVIFSMLSGH